MARRRLSTKAITYCTHCKQAVEWGHTCEAKQPKSLDQLADELGVPISQARWIRQAQLDPKR